MKKLWVLFAVVLLAACEKEEEEKGYWNLTVTNEIDNAYADDSIVTCQYYIGNDTDSEPIEFELKYGESKVIDLSYKIDDKIEQIPYETYTYLDVYYKYSVNGIRYPRSSREKVRYSSPNYMIIQ